MHVCMYVYTYIYIYIYMRTTCRGLLALAHAEQQQAQRGAMISLLAGEGVEVHPRLRQASERPIVSRDAEQGGGRLDGDGHQLSEEEIPERRV